MRILKKYNLSASCHTYNNIIDANLYFIYANPICDTYTFINSCFSRSARPVRSLTHKTTLILTIAQRIVRAAYAPRTLKNCVRWMYILIVHVWWHVEISQILLHKAYKYIFTCYIRGYGYGPTVFSFVKKVYILYTFAFFESIVMYKKKTAWIFI